MQFLPLNVNHHKLKKNWKFLKTKNNYKTLAIKHEEMLYFQMYEIFSDINDTRKELTVWFSLLSTW